MNGEHDAEVAQRLGPYRLLTRIGEGGMGVVHLGLDPDGRTVAVKVLHPHVAADQTSRARLAREVETMRRVSSQHVAEVLGAELHGERPYVATRYVPGRSLQDVVTSDGPLSGAALGRLAGGLAEALTAIHGAGVVHRDVKPSNVLLVDGEPVVIDFGVAQGIDASKLTQAGTFMGTPAYLAPEVLRGDPPSGAADVHAWAGVVAFAATGRQPFGAGPHESIFYNIARNQADLDGVPEPLARLVRAALASEPEQRPLASWLRQQVSELGELPGAGAEGPAAGERPPPPYFPDGTRGNGAGVLPPAAVHPPAAGPSPGTRQYTSQVPADTRVERPSPPHGPPPDPPPGARPVPPAGAYRQRPPRHPYPEERPRPALTRPPRMLVGGLLLAVLATFGAVAPFAAAITVVVLLVSLRTYEGVAGSLAIRRARRGPKPVDPLLGVAGSPWHLGKAALVTGLSLVLAVLAGVALTGVALLGTTVPANAVALGGAGFVLVSFFGPGGKVPRQRGERVLSAVLPGRLPAIIAGVVLGFLLLSCLAAVGSSTIIWWPWEQPQPSLPDAIEDSRLFGLAELLR